MKIKSRTRRIMALFLLNIMIVSILVKPVYAVYSYYSENDLAGDDKKIKEWTWSSAGENDALVVPLTPTGLSQQQTALMGGYTTKFWFQDVKAKTVSVDCEGQSIEIDFSNFNHRYYACADSHNTGWFAPVGSQMIFKQLYFPTNNSKDYPTFIQNAPVDMETRKFILLMISMLSAAYDTPSEANLKDSDQTSMYYYLLWLSIWANDVYAQHGVFHGISPGDDWDYVRDQLRVGLKGRLNPDSWGSSTIYDAFRDGGPAQTYFYNCWKAAKFLSSFDYRTDVGTSLSVSDKKMEEDGMFHVTFDYGGLPDYEKEVYRRLRADDLSPGWEYANDGGRIDFKSPDGEVAGDLIGILRLREASEEDRFFNCGFGVGGLAGFQGCAKGNDPAEPTWGNTQIYFSAVSKPLEISVSGKSTSTEAEIKRYQHDETWQAHYNVRLRKYDSETGQALAGSKWDILEAFDGSQLADTELEALDNWANRKGNQFKKWTGWDYGAGNPKGDIANDPCAWDINVTDEHGCLMLGDNEENASKQIAHTDKKSYTYTKGYCSGHPEPVIEKSGDEEIDAENEAAAWETWQEEVDRCEALAAEGGFYHSIEPGEAKAELEADRDKLYKQFISLKYEYSAAEITPRPGYTIHGGHTDDIPIEVKTVTSSEYKLRHKGRKLVSPEINSVIRPNHASSQVSPDSMTTPSSAMELEDDQKEKLKTDDEAITQLSPKQLNVASIIGFPINASCVKGFNTTPSALSFAMRSVLSQSSLSVSSQTQPPAPSPPRLPVPATPSSPAPSLSRPPVRATPSSPAPSPPPALATPSSPATSSDTTHEMPPLLDRFPDSSESPRGLIFRLGEKIGRLGMTAGRGSFRFAPSQIQPVSQGDSSIIDHTFIVYDHRTEGEIHINKRDLYLTKGEGGGYASYGDSMGDGTLEGAVYGLFAMRDISHPDGHSGVIYQKDDLVSMASTDRNGDASFLTFTEAPGMTWNYTAGEIKARQGGLKGPFNLHRPRLEADLVVDMENYEGSDPNGNSVSLKDSIELNGGGYRKCSSNQAGIWGLTGTFATYPIPNNEEDNGNCWIGRPLVVEKAGTSYYVKELTRSEGYELSVNGKSNLVTNGQTNYEGVHGALEVSLGDITLDSTKNGNYFSVTLKSGEHDVILKGIDFPKGAALGLSVVERVPEKIVVPVYDTVTKPIMALAGAYVYKEGEKVAANQGDVVSFPGGQIHRVQRVSEKSDQTLGIKPMNYHTIGIPTVMEPDADGTLQGFQRLYNQELDKMGYREPTDESPWVRMRLPSRLLEKSTEKPIERSIKKSTEKLPDNTAAEWVSVINQGIKDNDLQYFNSLRITDMEESGGGLYAILRYEWRLYGDERDRGVYVPEKDRLYVKKDGKNGYFVYTSYDGLDSNPAVVAYRMKHGFLEGATLKVQEVKGLKVAYPQKLPDTFVLETVQTSPYWVYDDGEQQLDDHGNPRFTEETTVDYVERQGFKEVESVTRLSSSYDVVDRVYTVTLPAGAFETTATVNLKVYDDGSGEYSAKRAYANGSHFVSIPVHPGMDSYIENITLTKPAVNQPQQDEGTRENRLEVFERPIMQKIKIIKDIYIDENGGYQDNSFAGSGHEDGFTENGGGVMDNASYRPGFRFKAYLKSNLEQLYRDEGGRVKWQDRNGNVVDIGIYRKAYPQKVQKIYTKVLHETKPLMRNSNHGAMANAALYGYTDQLIHGEQSPGYTAILEWDMDGLSVVGTHDKVVHKYNYEKFFQGIRVANEDKWDKVTHASTSFKPLAFIKSLLFGTASGENRYPAVHNNPVIENQVNVSMASAENAKCSDQVRQFAIDWYLDDEVKKLVRENGKGEMEGGAGGEGYIDETYDLALKHAIEKAENYLKPFFSYDLDEIYAIEWDDSLKGGSDGDKTTLSADQEVKDGQYCFEVSEYLPYGTYVVAEQQPEETAAGDFYNRHYEIHKPKELVLPSSEKLSHNYLYEANADAPEFASRFFIRFQEEWPKAWKEKAWEEKAKKEKAKEWIIKAHGYYGDYEIYKYGLDLDRLSGESIGDSTGVGHFNLAQEPTDPLKDYYNVMVDPEEAGGNEDSHYLADDENHGKIAPNGTVYEADGVERIYRYGSVSEDGQIYNGVPVSMEQGEGYRDNVAAMEGMQTAYDGTYAAMLVPWSVAEPTAGTEAGDFYGYDCVSFQNSFYKSRLRIEKLDSETGENILHDGAIFTIYAAKREDGEAGNGRADRYHKDTLIKGSKEFLESMGARQITQAARALPGKGKLWTGVVPEGTPICNEAEQIVMTDDKGRQTGRFEAFSTTRDGLQAEEEGGKEGGKEGGASSFQAQNAGYLITPKPLGAGTYVLCEVKPPAGYVRTRPIAMEVYSDKISYYLDGDRDKRVIAAIYKDGKEKMRVGADSTMDTARIYVGNAPIRLEVSKIKTEEETVTYQTATRVEGTEAELNEKHGRENLEFAYENGRYLGYAWPKGTLEYLESRRAAGEKAEPVYQNGIFAGYGLVTRRLDSADEENRYVVGAGMTLYDGIEVRANGDGGDFGYDGVEVRRDGNNNVISMKVLEGYGGSGVEFVNKDDVEGSLTEAVGAGNWAYQTIDRKAADIRYYCLGGLEVLKTGTDGRIYGYDRDGKRVLAKNRSSIYALKNGRPVFEMVGGDLEQTKYSAFDKRIFLPKETILYHVDFQGNRDSLTDPVTGMAYIVEEAGNKLEPRGKETERKEKKGIRIFVWPVCVLRTPDGIILSQEKIKTCRMATINADTKEEYAVGTFDGTNLKKKVNPVLSVHGLPEYYQRSKEIYKKGEPVFDVDHDYVRYRYYEGLFAFNRNAYRINGRPELLDVEDEKDPQDDKKLYHRQGEAWIMENTWKSGEAYPNDPFRGEMTAGKADMIKRILPGTYIMEEEEPPEGYQKGFPVGVTVREGALAERVKMKDERIKVEIVKTDAAPEYRLDIKSDYGFEGAAVEPKGAYGYGQIKGVRLGLWKAKRVYTDNALNWPKGYYLVKTENEPAKWTVDGSPGSPSVTVTAEWITDGSPRYFEGIPAGDYILEETMAPEGFVRGVLELEVKETGEVQTFSMKDDHTKLEIYKYYQDEDGAKKPLPSSHPAKLSLYKARTDGKGNTIILDGIPQYEEEGFVDSWLNDDLKAYTQVYEKGSGLLARMKDFLGLEANRSGFILDFETAYKAQKEGLVHLIWQTGAGKRSAKRISSTGTDRGESVTQLWEADDGSVIRITIYRNVTNGSLDEVGRLPLNFEYQFHYHELGDGLKSYYTPEGMRRFDYLPFTDENDGKMTGNYVLVETEAPQGFEVAPPKAITITETGGVQRFSLENKEKYLDVAKVIGADGKEIPVAGVKLGLYRANGDGEFTESEEYLEETWVSGSEGIYTAADLLEGKIPEGFYVGELRAHRIHKISYGIHYVAELETPPYVVKGPQVRIEIGQGTAALCRVVNHPAKGRLEIMKRGSDGGAPLKGARFQVKNQDTGQERYLVTGDDGKASLGSLPPGEVMPSGVIRPYTYCIEEITPPDFHQINGGKKKFQFDEAVTEQEVIYVYEVENRPTEIHLTKSDFGSGMLLPGAILSIFRAREEGGNYIKDGEAIETVTVGPAGVLLTGRLIAGHAYIMEEIEPPPGYAKAKPVLFTINEAGTGIGSVAADFAVFRVAYHGDFVSSLFVTGRVPTDVYQELRDLDTGEVIERRLRGGAECVLTGEDVVDGHLYERTEYTEYSDGNKSMSFRETRRLHLDEKGECVIPVRTFLRTKERLEASEGTLIEDWEVKADDRCHEIKNPVVREKIIAEITGMPGRGGAAVKKGEVVKYTITYENLHDRPEDVTVNAILEEGLTFMRATEDGVFQDGTVTWKVGSVAAHAKGWVDVVAVVSGESMGRIRAGFTILAGELKTDGELDNPIAPQGGITLINGLSGTDKNKEDEFTYQVRFFDSSGNRMTGYQEYDGSIKGRIKGEGKLVLRGDEFVTFPGLPYKTKYVITQVEARGYEAELGNQSGVVTKAGTSVVFKNHRDDKGHREVFIKNKTYVLTEMTCYADGAFRESGRYRFRFNDKGVAVDVDMEDRPVETYFSKVDIDSSLELDGGKYLLLKAKTGQAIYEFTKHGGEMVKLPSSLLTPLEEYVFQELEAPKGYCKADDIRFFVNQEGQPETVVMEDHKTQVQLIKVDIESGEALTGGRFQIKETQSGNSLYEFEANGEPIRLDGILTAEKEYELVELKPPAGYYESAPVKFTVPLKPELITVKMEDRPTDVIVGKEGSEGLQGKKPLTGCVLQILESDKSPARALRNQGGFRKGEILKFTTEKQGRQMKGQLAAGRSYLLHEVRPREGYAYAEDVEFTVSGDGRQVEVVMYDEPTHVEISKTEVTGEREIPGNHLIILDKDGEEVERWVSGEESHVIKARLIAGETYRLHEELPAYGYFYAQDEVFTVSANGSIDKVQMKNDMTSVRIQKVSEDGHPIKGAVLQIWNERKEVVVKDFITDGNPLDVTGKLTSGKSYYLHEVQAPPGYLPAADIPFIVPKDGKIITVTMTDVRESVEERHTMYLMKTDAATGAGLKGFAFSITEPGGRVFTAETGMNGRAKFDMPPDGVYTYRETKARPGHLLSEETYTFTVKHGRVTDDSVVLVADQPVPDGGRRVGTITASYQWELRENPGAVIRIRRYSGVKTGDEYPFWLTAVLLAAGLSILVYMVRKKKRGMDKDKKP